MRQRSRSYRDRDDDEDVIGDDFAAVNDRLDSLTRQLERMAQANAPVRAAAGDERADRVSDALARLDRRLDQVIAEGRSPANQFQYARQTPPPPAPHPQYAAPPQVYAAPQHYAPQPAYAPQQHYSPPQPPAPPPAPSRGPANWAAQISARQRALDGGPAAAPAPAPLAPPPAPVMPMAAPPQAPQQHWSPAPDMTGVEQQLHHINTQISSLHQPYENALTALRGDLAEIGRALTDALPRRAIEALEGEVRALSERVDKTRAAGAEGAALAALERELAEIRAALQHLTPAENLGGFEEAVRGLYQKLDQIAAAGGSPQGDPLAFKQLEQAVVSLRGIVSNVASDGALAQLSAEVRGLASQFERASVESSSEALGRLETRISTLMESGRAVPPELEGSIRQLSERLDRMQLSQGDQHALGALEDRIAKLSEKLDASDQRLGHLEAVERGLADLLVHLEEMKSSGGRSLRAPPPEPAPMPAMPSPPMPVAPAQAPVPAFAQSPLDLIPDMPPQQHYASVIEAPPLAPQPMPAPMQMAPAEAFAPPPPAPMPAPATPPMRQMPRGPQRHPIDPNLPPDTPLEPGSGAPRVKPGSAAARIAASKAALSHARPFEEEIGGKSAAIAAARNAAKAAYLDTPVKVPKSFAPKRPGWLKLPSFKRKAKDADFAPQFQAPAPQPISVPSAPPVIAPVQTMPPPAMMDDGDVDVRPSGGRRILGILKTLLIAASVAIIVVGVAQTAMEYLFPDAPSLMPGQPAKDQSKNPPEAGSSSAPVTQAPATTPSRPMPTPGGGAIAPLTPDPEKTDSIGNQSSFFDPKTAIKLPDVTGSIPQRPSSKTPSANPANSSNIELPPSVGPLLRTAVLANNPAGDYELGSRYAEGRGVTQNPSEAAHWFEKAADAGFAPAQFRLASMTEKGDGVKKDTQAARRLYLAAAAKGHAKSMHNLAVLYAEGIDGKPDYKAAAEWFRKASAYGVTDSEFNLAILYARGIGVTANLAESYRWFALAAASGDNDATKKRDEVASRLDAKTLAMAKAAAQGFVPDREPDEAVNLMTPPGGWDHAPAPAAKARR